MTRAARTQPPLLSLTLTLALAAVVACGGKKKEPPAETPPPAVRAGLEAIPDAARVVVGVDVRSLASSALVRRGVSQMLERDPALAARITGLLSQCELDPTKDIDGYLIGLGETPGQVILVATGRFDEAKLAGCVTRSVEASGGAITTTPQDDGRTLYTVRNPSAPGGDVWFAFGAPNTVLVAAGEPWLREALGDGKKLSNNSQMLDLMERADRTAAIWVAGRVEPDVGEGLVQVTDGAISAPPRAMFGHLRLTDGLDGELGAIMASPTDAKAVEEFAGPQLATLAMVAQAQGMGRLVSKLRVEADGSVVYLRVKLSAQDIEDLIAQIDRMTSGEQDTGSD